MPIDNELEVPESTVFASFGIIIQNALKRGLTIHPLKPRGKEPWLPSWPKAAAKTTPYTEDWAKRFPTSNYGVVANEEFCILESDDFGRLMELVSKAIPSTYVVQARANRPHIYFRQTEASRKAGNMDCPGVFEFKQNGRYVVGEGSVHPTGAVYTCLADEPIAPIPDWLVADLQRIRMGSGLRVSGPAPKEGETYGEKEGRQQFLMRTAGQLWDGVKTEEELFSELQETNLEHCDPPKETHKVLGMVEWVMKREPNVPHASKVTFDGPVLEGERRPGTAFDFVLAPTPGEVEGAFALGTVHLLIGSSGAGKTTFGIQMLQAQGRGEAFFERRTYRRKFLVVMQDRSEFEMERTFRRMKIEKDSFPFIAITPEQAMQTPASALEEIYKKEVVKPDILFVEGLDMWCSDAVEMKKVVPILAALQAFAKHYHVSVIGTVGAPKAKPKERYESPRDRAFGSSAWARRCDTVLDITVDEKTQERVVNLLLRNAPPQQYRMAFENGILVLRKPAIVTGPDLTPKELAAKLGVTERTAQRYKKTGKVPNA